MFTGILLLGATLPAPSDTTPRKNDFGGCVRRLDGQVRECDGFYGVRPCTFSTFRR